MTVYGNPPNYPEMVTWRQVLRPADLFVDVGANIGSYSIWAGEMGANVIALEPADDTFALLSETSPSMDIPSRRLKPRPELPAGTPVSRKGATGATACIQRAKPRRLW